MANDALEQSLRAEIDKHFNARLNDLREEMSRIQGLLNETVERHKSETDSIIGKMMEKISEEDDAMNSVIAEHLRNAEVAAAEAAARAAEEVAAERAAAAEQAAARAAAEQAAAQAAAEQAAAQAAAEQAAEEAAAAQAAAERAEEEAAASRAAAQAAAEQAAAEQAAAQAAVERAEEEAAAAQAAAEQAAEEAAAARAAAEQAAAEQAAAQATAEAAVARAAAAEQDAKRISAENISLLRNAIVDLGKQKSQADILKTLVGYSASLAPRVAFFVVKEGHTKGWRAFGFENTVGNDSINQIVLPLSDQTLLAEAVKTQTTWDGSSGQYQDDYKLLSELGSVNPDRMAAVPLTVRGRTVAVLYADSGNDPADSINVEAIESLIQVAGMNVEMLAASRMAAAAGHVAVEAQPAVAAVVVPQTETVSATPAPPVPSEEASTAETTVEEEETQVVSREPEPEPVSEEVEAEPAVEEQTVEEERSFDLSGYQTPTLVETMPVQTYAPVETPVESQTFSTPSQTTTTVTPIGTESRFRRREIDLPIEVSEEERRFHNEARRFARLLVSEIKLYNEPRVKEGRETKDLYDRLREAIDRSREMYDKRVSPQVASKFDYFHYELVSTLAEGDENKLGSDYPGASV